RIGALVRHKTCERAQELRGRFGALADAAPLISDPIVRNLGTVAGSLVHADPQGDWGSVMLAVRARVEARSAAGAAQERTVHRGVEHVFCCGGCRAAFLADPEQYAGARPA
ncbi:MAG: FAD binding domain-containing protein, partial [Thermoleophilia bacterium]|nr:FAD binding domain-containing protein [Thermoleophilia bacterium]